MNFENINLRAMLIKLRDRLPENDQQRLRFLVGNLNSTQLCQSPSLGDLLTLLESLLDQNKISQQEFNDLIQAFNIVHCYNAVDRLKGYQRFQEQWKTILPSISDNTKGQLSASNTNSNPGMLLLPFSPIKKVDSFANIHKKKSSRSEASLKKVSESLSSNIGKCVLGICFIALLATVLSLIFLQRKFFLSIAKESEVTIIQAGPWYSVKGEEQFDDTAEISLTLASRITDVKIRWSKDVLDSLSFIYSDKIVLNQSHGAGDSAVHEETLHLTSGENINRVTIVTEPRIIVDPVEKLNKTTNLIVGLQFHTTHSRSSPFFGSWNGHIVQESFDNSTIGFLRVRRADSSTMIQFVWFKRCPVNKYLSECQLFRPVSSKIK